MAPSVGAAAVQGIESGFNLGLRGAAAKADEEERRRRQANEDADRTERATDRADQRTRQVKADERLAAQDKRTAQQDTRLAKADERQAAMDRLKLLDSEIGELSTQGTALYSQYGGFDKVPEDVRAEYSGRVKTARERRAAERNKFYEPDVAEAKRDAAEKWSRIEAGQMTLDQLSDDDLYRTLVVQTRRPMTDFLRPKEGSASPIEQAALDLEAGMQTGNMDLTLRAANELLKPELATGVGSESKDGSEILSKRIVKLVPHPQDPSRFVPIVEVKVKRGDGATGTYLAPITENRSADPTDNVKTISLQDALDRVGQLKTLASAVNRPDLRKRIEKGAEGPGKAAGDDFLAALGSIGVTPPKRQVTSANMDLGDRVRVTERDASGNVISEKDVRKGATPKQAGSVEGGEKLGKEEKEIRRALGLGLITPEEAKTALRNNALGLKAAGSDEKALTEGQAKANLFGKRMMAADTALEAVGTKYSQAKINAKVGSQDVPMIGGLANMVGNAMLTENEQQVEQAQRDFINAVLRRESGAAISDAEFRNAKQQYFPQPNDGDKVIEQKRANRRTAMEGMFEELPKSRRPTLPERTGSVSGGWDKPPVDLPKDAAAADAAYAKLPSGAIFVGPDGVKRRKP